VNYQSGNPRSLRTTQASKSEPRSPVLGLCRDALGCWSAHAAQPGLRALDRHRGATGRMLRMCVAELEVGDPEANATDTYISESAVAGRFFRGQSRRSPGAFFKTRAQRRCTYVSVSEVPIGIGGAGVPLAWDPCCAGVGVGSPIGTPDAARAHRKRATVGQTWGLATADAPGAGPPTG
jgi:hypothetical protein